MRVLRTPVLVLALAFVTLSVCQAKTNYAYVANYSANTVSIINTSNNTVVKTIAVGTSPQFVAVNQAGSSVYVTNTGSNNVSVISTGTNTVSGTITVGSAPLGVAFAPNGKVAYVANVSSNSISVINTGTKKVTATVPVQSSPTGIAVAPNGAFVYVSNSGSNSVSVVSTLTNTVIATLNVCANPSLVSVSPDGSAVYVPCDSSANAVSVIRTADNSVVNTINILHSGYGSAVSPDGHWLYVADSNGKTVTVVDTSTQAVVATIVVGSSPRSPAFTQDSMFAYVPNYSSGDVSVINTASQTVVTTISGVSGAIGAGVMGTMKVSTVAGGYVGDKGPATSATLGGPYASALDSAGNLYIADVFMNRVREVSTTGTITTYAGTGICGYNGEKIKATQENICNSDGLTFDPSGNLVVGSGDGRIRKIDHKTGLVTTIAGNGLHPYNPGDDGGPALKAAVGQVFQISYDAAGNMFFDSVGQCTVRKVDTSGIIHTVAGTGTCGYNGDGILATAAQLNLPRGVVVDGSGNVYIGDTLNHRVRKVDGSGNISTFAGTGNPGYGGDGGLATAANIGNPRELTIQSGALYISQAGRTRFRSVDLTTNIINTYAGSFYGYDGDGHSLLTTEFSSAFFVLFDSSGNPIFDDSWVGRVRKATGGIVNTIAGGFIGDGNKATSAAFVLPEALAIDKSGNMFVADWTGNRVRKVSGGIMSTIAGVTGVSGYAGDGGLGSSPNALLFAPQGVAVDSAGNVFIADTNNAVIREVNAAGTISTFATNTNFSYLLQMTTDSSNNLYVADNGACVVWKITPTAVVSVVAGVVNTCGYNGDGISATTAQLNGPYSVAVDASGNLFIADNGNNRIREVNSSGTISTVAGDGNCGYSGNGGSATAAEICSPYGVVVNKSGTIYLSDANLTIRKISGGTITGFAGTGLAGFGFTGDGMWPLLTNFSEPIALALDSNGTLYVLDDFDHRVRTIK